MKQDVHSKAVPETTISELETSFNTQLQTLMPYATPLTSDDHHKMLKTGPKTLKFVGLAHTLAKLNPQLTSRAFDMEAFTIDYKDTEGILGLLSMSRQVTEILEDIAMAAGSDAQHYALEFYADVKAAAARNVPEARAIYEQLKEAYPVRNRKHRSVDKEET